MTVLCSLCSVDATSLAQLGLFVTLARIGLDSAWYWGPIYRDSCQIWNLCSPTPVESQWCHISWGSGCQWWRHQMTADSGESRRPVLMVFVVRSIFACISCNASLFWRSTRNLLQDKDGWRSFTSTQRPTVKDLNNQFVSVSVVWWFVVLLAVSKT